MKKTCERCRTEYEPPKVKAFGVDLGRFITTCDACSELEDEESKQLELKRIEEHKRRKWEECVPAEYRLTNQNHPDYPSKIHEVAMAWIKKRFVLRHDDANLFFGLIGTSGLGKTRVISQAVKRLIWLGESVCWMNSSNFQWACQNQFSKVEGEDACRWLNTYRKSSILVFDDLGSIKSTEVVSDTFYSILEYRTSRSKPMLWTSNETTDEILAGINEKARLRSISRLSGYSTIIAI